MIVLLFTVFIAGVWVWFFKNSDKSKILYNKGKKAFKQKDYRVAKSFFLKLYDAHPDYNNLLSKLGATFFELKDYKNAISFFEKDLKKKPNNFDSLFMTAHSYRFLEQYDEAKDYYTKAMKLDESNWSVHFNLGLVEFAKGDFTSATEFFDKANALSEDSSIVRFYINRCKDELCEYGDESCDEDSILREYLSIAKLQELPKEFSHAIAKAYAKTGNIADALAYCKEALANNPEDVDSYKLLVLIQLVKKDFVGAKNTALTALSLDSANQELHDLLSYVICQQKEGCVLKKCREKYKEMARKFFQ